MQDKLKITNKHIIDWYDDLVSGLITLDENPKWLFISLIAWSQKNNEKIYAIANVNNYRANKLIQLLSKKTIDKKYNWRLIREQIEQIKIECKGEATLINCANLDQVKKIIKMDIDKYDLRSILGKDEETALFGDHVKFYFNLFN